VKVKVLEQKKKTHEQIPQIVNRIFAICKNDSNFPLKNEMEDVDSRIQEMKVKITKQDNLLEQSSELKKDLIQRIEVINDSNSRLQMRLLENLGSEL